MLPPNILSDRVKAGLAFSDRMYLFYHVHGNYDFCYFTGESKVFNVNIYISDI